MKKLHLINGLLILALVVSFILPAYTPVNAVGPWVMKQGLMSTGRTYFASAVANGKIYAIGGDNSGNQENYTIEEYNPATDIWSLRPVSHLPRIRFGAAAINNKIYIIGGSHQGLPYQYDKAVEEYDPVTNQITLKAPMLNKRCFLGVVALNNKIYAIGGFNNTGDKTMVEVYDPLDTSNGYDANGNPMGKWTTKTSMPTPKHSFSIATANGRIYTIAGKGATGTLRKVEEYNPQTDTWAAKTDLSISWDANVATSFDDMIYMVGGGISGIYNQKICKEYNPITDTWKDMPNMLKGMQNGAVDCIDGKLYAFGGEINTPYGQIEMFDLNRTWAFKQGMMSRRSGFASAVVNGKIYAIGDEFGGYNYTIEEYNPATDTWAVKMGLYFQPRISFGAAAVNNKIYIIGGYHQGLGNLIYDNTVEEYDPLTNQITLKAPIPTLRCNLGVIALNNKIYVMGGAYFCDTINTVEVYDPQTDIWTTKTSMPIGKSWFAIAEANGKIYTIGGRIGNDILRSIEEYDPQTDVWTTKTDLPIIWEAMAVTSLYGKIYAAGGGVFYVSWVYNQKIFKEYNPITDTWIDMPDLLKGMTKGGLVCIDGNIYAFGGDVDAPVGQIEMFH
jgi:N-acetylneuraminic acid mutarotase